MVDGRVLVVYFSQGQAARRVAMDLAGLTGADVDSIIELKQRKGALGFFLAGADASFGRATAIAEPALSPADYAVVYICSPIWAWNLAPAVRSWLRMFKGRIAKAAFVTVSGDTAPDKVVRVMAKESAVEPFAFAGFSEYHFQPEFHEDYVGKLAALVRPLR
jgi:hypothetical protein